MKIVMCFVFVEPCRYLRVWASGRHILNNDSNKTSIPSSKNLWRWGDLPRRWRKDLYHLLNLTKAKRSVVRLRDVCGIEIPPGYEHIFGNIRISTRSDSSFFPRRRKRAIQSNSWPNRHFYTNKNLETSSDWSIMRGIGYRIDPRPLLTFAYHLRNSEQNAGSKLFFGDNDSTQYVIDGPAGTALYVLGIVPNNGSRLNHQFRLLHFSPIYAICLY